MRKEGGMQVETEGRSAGGGQREEGRQESRRATSFLEIRTQFFILKGRRTSSLISRQSNFSPRILLNMNDIHLLSAVVGEL